MKFTRDLSHFMRIFRPVEEAVQPQELVEAVVPIVDTFGSRRWNTVENITQDSQLASNTVSWNTAAPTGPQFFYIPYMSLEHNDGAASHTLWISIFDTIRELAIRSPLTVSTGQPVAILRPLVIPRRFSVRGRSSDVLPAGTSLFLRYVALTFDDGEYINPTA